MKKPRTKRGSDFVELETLSDKESDVLCLNLSL